jgi:DNA-directed RNA polymerase subunit H (RpoH/RPB5)
MHILQPKHTKLDEKEAQKILTQLNVSKAQLPKINSTDAGLKEPCNVGDMIKIERKEVDAVNTYYRVVV